jgi:transcriptional regulator with XRE-family HTH domain
MKKIEKMKENSHPNQLGEHTLKDQFIQLRAEGYSFEKISKKLKKAKGTLIEWERDFEEEISNYKALHLEQLYEKYFLLKQSRLELFGETLLKLKKELDTRTFASVPTDKLLDLVAKYHGFLKEEYTEPQFSTQQEQQKQKQDLANLLTLLIDK